MALEGALILAILIILAIRFKEIRIGFIEATSLAVGGALLAGMNTASEYGFGAVISALPGFLVVRNVMIRFRIPCSISQLPPQLWLGSQVRHRVA